MTHNALLEEQNISFINWVTHMSIEKVKKNKSEEKLNQLTELHDSKQVIWMIFYFINMNDFFSLKWQTIILSSRSGTKFTKYPRKSSFNGLGKKK